MPWLPSWLPRHLLRLPGADTGGVIRGTPDPLQIFLVHQY